MSEWTDVSFGDLFDLIYRYPTYFGIEYVENGVPEIRGELLTPDGKILDDTRFISSATAIRYPKVRLRAGDFVMSVRGTLGKIGLVSGKSADAVITANLLRLSPNRSKVESGWLRQVFLSKAFQEQLENACSQTTIRTIQVPQLCQLRTNLPPLPQQRKIARILTTVDNLIEKTEALIAKYQAMKQGMMHDLFTRGVDEHGHLRPPYEEAPELYKESELGWIPKEWEVSLLDDSIRIIDCKHYTPQFRKEGLPFIRPRNVKLEGLDLTDVEFVSSDDFRLLTDKHQPRRGDIVFSRNASFGVPCFIDHDHPFAIGQDTVVMTKKMVNTKYVFYALLSATTEQQVRKASTGSTFGRINLAFIRAIKIPLPKSREQLEISQRLNGIVGQIINESFALDKLRLVKSGLMQDLLTGKVRVKVDETEVVPHGKHETVF